MKEIVIEEKIHITEVEERIEEEIPVPVQGKLVKKVESDGNDLIRNSFGL